MLADIEEATVEATVGQPTKLMACARNGKKQSSVHQFQVLAPLPAFPDETKSGIS